MRSYQCLAVKSYHPSPRWTFICDRLWTYVPGPLSVQLQVKLILLLFCLLVLELETTSATARLCLWTAWFILRILSSSSKTFLLLLIDYYYVTSITRLLLMGMNFRCLWFILRILTSSSKSFVYLLDYYYVTSITRLLLMGVNFRLMVVSSFVKVVSRERRHVTADVYTGLTGYPSTCAIFCLFVIMM